MVQFQQQIRYILSNLQFFCLVYFCIYLPFVIQEPFQITPEILKLAEHSDIQEPHSFHKHTIALCHCDNLILSESHHNNFEEQADEVSGHLTASLLKCLDASALMLDFFEDLLESPEFVEPFEVGRREDVCLQFLV